MQGIVKVYDPSTGAGIVVLERDRSEVYLRPGSLAGSIFTSLRQGQRIVFEVVEEANQRFAINIGVGSEGS